MPGKYTKVAADGSIIGQNFLKTSQILMKLLWECGKL